MKATVLVLALVCAVPMFAAAIAADVTLPVAGHLELPNDLVYRTEITLTNHRDVRQAVMMYVVADGHAVSRRGFSIEPRETIFSDSGFLPTGGGVSNVIGAFRFVAVDRLDADDDDRTFDAADPQGRLEVSAHIVADRGRFASRGSSRQEVAGIPSTDYTAEEAVFLGVRHSFAAYTNVGVVNMHPTETVTFYVQFQYQDPVPVTVAPNSLAQIRITGPGNGGRFVRVTPEWALTDEAPAHTTPWVAYASTVDAQTGDAFSGIRVPSNTKYDR